jgi:hypothetical protein
MLRLLEVDHKLVRHPIFYSVPSILGIFTYSFFTKLAKLPC